MKFDLKEMQKKGSIGFDKTTNTLIGIVITIVLVIAFAPTIFGGLANLTLVEGVPSWLVVAAPIVVGVTVFKLLYR